MNPWAIASIVFNSLLLVVYSNIIRQDSDLGSRVIIGILAIIRIILLSFTIKYAVIKNPTKKQQKTLQFLGIFSIFVVTEGLYLLTIIFLMLLLGLILNIWEFFVPQERRPQRQPPQTETLTPH